MVKQKMLMPLFRYSGFGDDAFLPFIPVDKVGEVHAETCLPVGENATDAT